LPAVGLCGGTGGGGASLPVGLSDTPKVAVTDGCSSPTSVLVGSNLGRPPFIGAIDEGGGGGGGLAGRLPETVEFVEVEELLEEPRLIIGLS